MRLDFFNPCKIQKLLNAFVLRSIMLMSLNSRLVSRRRLVGEVPIGKRIALEVVRKGFVTRRLVIDGSEAKVRVALVAERHNKTTRPEQQDHEELAEPRDEPPATEEADDGLTDEAPLISEPVGRHAAP